MSRRPVENTNFRLFGIDNSQPPTRSQENQQSQPSNQNRQPSSNNLLGGVNSQSNNGTNPRNGNENMPQTAYSGHVYSNNSYAQSDAYNLPPISQSARKQANYPPNPQDNSAYYPSHPFMQPSGSATSLNTSASNRMGHNPDNASSSQLQAQPNFALQQANALPPSPPIYASQIDTSLLAAANAHNILPTVTALLAQHSQQYQRDFTALTQQIHGLAAGLAGARQENEQLRLQLSAAGKDIEQLRAATGEMSRDGASTRQAMGELVQRVGALGHDTSDVRTQLQTMSTQVREVNAITEEVRAQCGVLAARAEERERTHARLEGRVSELTVSVEDAQKATENARGEAATMIHAHETAVAGEFTQMRGAVVELKNVLYREAELRKTQMEQVTAALTAEMGTVRTQVQADIGVLRANTSAELQAMRNDIGGVRAMILAEREALATVRQSVRGLGATVERQSEAHAALQTSLEAASAALLTRVQTVESTVENEGKAILATLAVRDRNIEGDITALRQVLEQVRTQVDKTAQSAVAEFTALGSELSRIKTEFATLHSNTVRFIEHSTELALKAPQEGEIRQMEGKIRVLEDVSKELALYQAMQQQKEPETAWFRQFISDVSQQQQRYIDMRLQEVAQRVTVTHDELVRVEDVVRQGLIAADNQLQARVEALTDRVGAASIQLREQLTAQLEETRAHTLTQLEQVLSAQDSMQSATTEALHSLHRDLTLLSTRADDLGARTRADAAAVGERVGVLESVVRAEVRNRLDSQRKNAEWCVGVWEGVEERVKRGEALMKVLCGEGNAFMRALDRLRERVSVSGRGRGGGEGEAKEGEEMEERGVLVDGAVEGDGGVCGLILNLLSSNTPPTYPHTPRNTAADEQARAEAEAARMAQEQERVQLTESVREASSAVVATNAAAAAAAAAAAQARAAETEARSVVSSAVGEVRRAVELESRFAAQTVASDARRAVEAEVRDARRAVEREARDARRDADAHVRAAAVVAAEERVKAVLEQELQRRVDEEVRRKVEEVRRLVGDEARAAAREVLGAAERDAAVMAREWERGKEEVERRRREADARLASDKERQEKVGKVGEVFDGDGGVLNTVVTPRSQPNPNPNTNAGINAASTTTTGAGIGADADEDASMIDDNGIDAEVSAAEALDVAVLAGLHRLLSETDTTPRGDVSPGSDVNMRLPTATIAPYATARIDGSSAANGDGDSNVGNCGNINGGIYADDNVRVTNSGTVGVLDGNGDASDDTRAQAKAKAKAKATVKAKAKTDAEVEGGGDVQADAKVKAKAGEEAEAKADVDGKPRKHGKIVKSPHVGVVSNSAGEGITATTSAVNSTSVSASAFTSAPPATPLIVTPTHTTPVPSLTGHPSTSPTLDSTHPYPYPHPHPHPYPSTTLEGFSTPPPPPITADDTVVPQKRPRRLKPTSSSGAGDSASGVGDVKRVASPIGALPPRITSRTAQNTHRPGSSRPTAAQLLARPASGASVHTLGPVMAVAAGSRGVPARSPTDTETNSEPNAASNSNTAVNAGTGAGAGANTDPTTAIRAGDGRATQVNFGTTAVAPAIPTPATATATHDICTTTAASNTTSTGAAPFMGEGVRANRRRSAELLAALERDVAAVDASVGAL